MNFVLRILDALVLAAIFAGIVIGLEVGLLWIIATTFDIQIRPRGAGWAILPLIALWAGLKAGWEMEGWGIKTIGYGLVAIGIGTVTTAKGRIFIVFSTLWSFVWTTYANSTWGSYWSDHDTDFFWTWLTVPIVTMGAALVGSIWIRNADKK